MWKLKLPTLVTLAVCCCAAESASWSDRAPLITQYGCEGLPLSLTCRKPPPGRIIWFKITDTKQVMQITPDHRIKIDVKGTLQFSSVNVKDTAVYKCGVSIKSTITLGSPVNLKVIKVYTSFCDNEITKTVGQSNPSRTIKTMFEKDLSAGKPGNRYAVHLIYGEGR
ncbi:uncharacterized protein LOC125374910 [Haliotis rufescens]|uniref:uncharacterized protein LOC125374910 n=1 Tax=Haliotis rufescens TaxID=6454 RepID=UPI00201EA28F|nr:uncharacterized protein LOC125374910 [Haliotis rufescens]